MKTKSRPHVLIVDDMIVNRMILASFLETEGVASDEAESGADCIALCKKNDYDIILLDHRMPGLDGVDTLAALKDMFREAGRVLPPVICHTTGDAKNNSNLYKAAGFSDVIIKPVQQHQIIELIEKYIGERPEADRSIVSAMDDADDDEPRSILFIGEADAVEEKLAEQGFNISHAEESIEALMQHTEGSDIILYNATESKGETALLVHYLADFCRISHRALVLIGDESLLSGIENKNNLKAIHLYGKDTAPDVVADDIKGLTGARDEYRRKKRIVVVSDDREFVDTLKRWTKNESYEIHDITFDDMDTVLTEESDAILIDCTTFRVASFMAKTKDVTAPIIFVDDDFDNEEQTTERPDGYFSKSMTKTAFVDSLNRFFKESIFRA